MREVQEAASLVQEQAHEEANIIFGASLDESMGDSIKVTVIATGFDTVEQGFAQDSPASRLRTSPMSAYRSGASVQTSARTSGWSEPAPASPAHRPPPIHEVRRPSQGESSASLNKQASNADLFSSPLDPDWETPSFQRRQK